MLHEAIYEVLIVPNRGPDRRGNTQTNFFCLKTFIKEFIVLSCFGEDLSNLPLKRRINKLFKPQTLPCYKNILFAVKFHGPVDVATQKRAISV